MDAMDSPSDRIRRTNASHGGETVARERPVVLVGIDDIASEQSAGMVGSRFNNGRWASDML